jgi:hypothetical protein
MIYAVMNEDRVENTIVADKEFVDEFYPTAIDITKLDSRPEIGWTYDGKKFIAPMVIDEPIS